MMRAFSPIFNAISPLGIPLAWRQLTRDRKRFVTAIAGVTFGTVLMLNQLGLYNAMMRMVVFPHKALKGELVMTSRNYEYFGANRPFSRRILYQIQGFPGVASVAPLYMDWLKWKNTTTSMDREIVVLAINPSQNPFALPDVADQVRLLTDGESVLFDAQSAEADFGHVGAAFRKQGEVLTELANVRVAVKGLFSMGRTLAANGHVITSDQALGRLNPSRPANLINVGLVTLQAGADPREVQRRLTAFLPSDVRVMTREELQSEEQEYWLTRTAIGFTTLAGMLVGLFVGAVVLYQILYTDVTDHMREYATLKAMGITDWFLLRVIMTEAAILLLASALPSVLIAGGLFTVTRVGSGMPTELTVSELLIVSGLSVVMCVFSGFLATRKLKTADPADIF